MKNKYLIIGLLGALLTGACTQTGQEQPQPPAPTPELLADEQENTDSELTTEENAESPGTAETITDDAADTGSATENEADLAPARKEHVCSGLLSCKLGLCPNGRKRKAALAAGKPEPTPESPAPTAEEAQPEAITPSPEQMEAAQKLLAEESKTPAAPARKKQTAPRAPRPTPAEDYSAPSVTVENTSGIPGASGLRAGSSAMPEEAASSYDNDLPLPNAVERHGLRSPSLPSALPMNIDGQTHRNR